MDYDGFQTDIISIGFLFILILTIGVLRARLRSSLEGRTLL